jgi:D-xylulose reductase
MVFAATPPYDGTLARYYRIPGDIVYRLGESMSLEDGAMVWIMLSSRCASEINMVH